MFLNIYKGLGGTGVGGGARGTPNTPLITVGGVFPGGSTSQCPTGVGLALWTLLGESLDHLFPSH